MGKRCKNIPQKMREEMEKRAQEDKIETHEDALIELGYLPKPKGNKKKKVNKKKVNKKKVSKKVQDKVKTKKKVKIEKTDSDSEEETEIT